MFRGKNYKESAKLIDKQAQYEPQEAFELITKTAKAKFDETVELHVKPVSYTHLTLPTIA
mgnify:CR=1 FL=1